jgi:hypothetical protein
MDGEIMSLRVLNELYITGTPLARIRTDVGDDEGIMDVVFIMRRLPLLIDKTKRESLRFMLASNFINFVQNFYMALCDSGYGIVCNNGAFYLALRAMHYLHPDAPGLIAYQLAPCLTTLAAQLSE